ncbi:MAG: sulfate ABC transporter permease subunit CysW [Polyangiaceae bacterium]|jgi:sulfate transport system permease protein|nr:sulfate ABC transporter permease subunit CysW [Polyangiaceae bacterium]MBK8941826.1 sulfate ABC transporter permease subunit CysW [Polyangiaceae bacterium]
MAGVAGSVASRAGGASKVRRVTRDPAWARALLMMLALGFVGLFVVAPLAVVFSEAVRGGLGPFVAAVAHPETWSAIKLSLLVVVLAVPLNIVFGVAAAWAIARFEFRGKGALITLIDLPFAVSPVVSGMIFVLLFGGHGLLGPYLRPMGIKVIFALPGIVLATAFVTFPFVARELIPFWQARGSQDEEAAQVLGAGPWTTLFRVSLPTAKYALLYGVVLSTARALGEFGAVSVVSGHIRGRTNTLPLHVEILYGEYQFQAAFAVASLFALMGIATLGAKWALERKMAADHER